VRLWAAANFTLCNLVQRSNRCAPSAFCRTTLGRSVILAAQLLSSYHSFPVNQAAKGAVYRHQFVTISRIWR
jgi:hypothetical protein